MNCTGNSICRNICVAVGFMDVFVYNNYMCVDFNFAAQFSSFLIVVVKNITLQMGF